MSGPAAIADAIKNMRAMTALNLSSNAIGGYTVPEGWKYLPANSPATRFYNTATKNNQGEPPAGASQAGVVAVANAIEDMGAILSVNLLKNGIDVDQANDFVGILKEHPTLKSLCGNNGNETELDMSGKMNSPEDAIMLAAEIVDNGALTSLDISDNELARGAYKGGSSYSDASYATDTTGICVCVAPKFFSDAMLL